MKTTFAAASFALIAALSGLSTAHAAGFNERSVVPNAVASSPSSRQDLHHVQVTQGFNEQSQLPSAARQPTSRASSGPVLAGAHCDLNPRAGFQNSTSFASC
jgi:hypothetical protein